MKIKNFGKILFVIILILSFSLSLPVLADGDTTETVTIVNPLTDIDKISTLIQRILEGAIKIGLPIVTLAIIYSGFLFVEAQGNTEKLGKAKDTLLYTLIGAAILLGSWVIAQIITNTVTSL